ncbi:MAG: AarF/UbiB family protein [Pseudomonadota bacterium]|nr:AarF/UbiB family protein [Pseudomonadota bacterium]
MGMLSNPVKDVKRLNEIFSILIKYGFGDVLRRMGLANTVEQASRLMRTPISNQMLNMQPPERFRCAIEEMGPTFIKLGQILATRVDLFSQDMIHELEKLQDNAPVMPYAEIEPLIEKALGAPPAKVFRHINEQPLASASIAQVHEAMTKKGERVVLKVRKPGVRRTIEADLRLMHSLARLINIQSVELRRYRPEEMVREFERSLRRELDFTIEAKNSERIARNLRKFKWLKIPKVYWQWTSETLNVQEYVQGTSAKDAEALDRMGVDRELLARRGSQVAWKCMLEDGLFHADPHPGNFYVLPGNGIAMLDFGMVGKLSYQRREQIIRLVRSIIFQETDTAAAVLVEWSNSDNIDVEALARDCADLVEQYYGLNLSEIDIPQVILDCMALMRNYDLVMPSDITLAAKAFITLEGFGRLVKPDFNLMDAAEPLIRDLIKKRYHPVRLARSLGSRAIKMVDRIYEPPSELPQVHSQGSSAKMDAYLMDRLSYRLEDASYRQTQAIYDVGFLIMFTLLLITPHGPRIYDISVLNVIGVLGVLGVMANVARIQVVTWWQRKKRDLS